MMLFPIARAILQTFSFLLPWSRSTNIHVKSEVRKTRIELIWSDTDPVNSEVGHVLWLISKAYLWLFWQLCVQHRYLCSYLFSFDALIAYSSTTFSMSGRKTLWDSIFRTESPHLMPSIFTSSCRSVRLEHHFRQKIHINIRFVSRCSILRTHCCAKIKPARKLKSILKFKYTNQTVPITLNTKYKHIFFKLVRKARFYILSTVITSFICDNNFKKWGDCHII